ncbi:fructoselysine 3-epimerase [Anaerotignum lactatifermentans]|uniref:Fructoselysine 3-epimerase n=1 Tax=Anaerotignum lactatifermentans TaxID=160404 RepID=A0ABS2GBV2_9FIRM|nr:fructoselysine 3-epimerase [Anaerotignum lactatifermentans]MBM6829792.1 fructoselysine 3-epimerase [Anaerotignum lactatifermentans]MBM6878268.1 fructoselysine 3-epimerase [Anaerotignum lactatifermentans]MBM6951348.1 fructoselysine 3-epimerase [Anaerotignum lactatifermentans]
MRLGLFTCGYQRYSLEKAFADARRFGYDYIELWGGFPHACVEDLKTNTTAQIRALTDKYEMPVECFTPEHNAYPFNYMMGSEAQWERSMSYLEDAIDVTAELGAKKMLFSAGHAGYEAREKEIFARLEKSLRRLADYAQKRDVTLILEPLTVYESNVICGLRDLDRALTAVEHPHLAGMCDLAVPFTTGEPAAEYVKRLGKRFRYLHIIDNDGVSDSHLLPGEGRIPLREVLTEIRRAGYDGQATIELVTGYLKEPSVYAGLAMKRIREALEED